MLFVPPSMPFMDPVPEAEAAPMDSPADAITDLSLQSISKKNNRSDRNSITLSWSAPNDNGSPIVFYHVQVHSISGSGWVTLENDVYGTTYTHDNGDQGVATGYQYSYRVFAIASDGCNGNTSNFVDNCNESNILHVVSLPDAASGTPISQCNNSALADCGYFPPEYYGVNLSFESLNISSSGGSTTTFPGDTIQITPTVKWDFGEGSGIVQGDLDYIAQQGNPIVHGGITFPDGSTGDQFGGWWTQTEYFLGALSTQSGTITPVANTWNVDADTNNPNVGPGSGQEGTYHGAPWPVGEYTVTFTVDYGDMAFSETSESDNVITGTFTVAAPADTTPPVVTISEVWASESSPVNIPENQVLTTSNSTGYEFFFFTSSSDTSANATCSIDSSMQMGNTDPYYITYYGVLFPVGTNTITCTATDAAGNVGTASFTVTVNALADTTPPVLIMPANLVFEATTTYTHAGVEYMSTSRPDAFQQGSANFPPNAIDDVDGPIIHFQSEHNDIHCDIVASAIPNYVWDWDEVGFEEDRHWILGTNTITCTATDAAGNAATASFTVTVNAPTDTTPPVLIMPADLVFEATTTYTHAGVEYISAVNATAFPWGSANFPPNAIDDVDGPISHYDVECDIVSAIPNLIWDWDEVGFEQDRHWILGTNTITCTATDAAGNVGTASFTIIVTTADAPPLITPSITASAFLNATSSTGRTLTANQGNWADEVSANAGTTYWQVLYTITDPNGASVADSLGQAGWPINFFFGEPDQPYGSQTHWSVEIPVSWEAGAYTITSSVHSSASWNTDPVVIGPYSTTVTVPATSDTIPPVVSVPNDLTFTTTGTNYVITTSAVNSQLGLGTSSNPYQIVTATDNVDGTIDGSCNKLSGTFYTSQFSDMASNWPTYTWWPGTVTITCTATDAAGNVGTASFTITVVVEGAADTTYPAETAAIIGNANYLAQTNQQPHQFSGNTAKIYVVFNENVPTMGSLVNIIAVFPNAQSGVSLNSVNVPYALTYPGGTEEGVLTSINTNNLYDMVLSINSAPVAGHYVFQTELISTSFDVYGPDTTPPVITVPADITVTTSDLIQFTNSTGTYNGAIGWSGSGVLFSDDVGISDGDCTGNYSPPGWSNGPVTFPVNEATTVTCTATDESGNVGTASFTVTVNYVASGTPPAVWLAFPANPVLTTTNSTGFQALIQHQHNPSRAFVTYSTDPTDTTVSTNYGDSNPIWFEVSAIDDTDSPSMLHSQYSPTCTPGSTSGVHEYQNQQSASILFPIGTTTVTCTATDAEGNMGTTSFPVTVVLEGSSDTTTPTSAFATGFGGSQGHSGYLHMDIDSSGIYTADSRLKEVKKLDFSGNVLFTITSNISSAKDIAVFQQNIFVSDSNSIKKFSSSGNYLGTFATVSGVKNIGITPNSGTVYASANQGGQHYVYKFNNAGDQIDVFPVNYTYALEVDPSGSFYISNFLTPTAQPWVVSKYSNSGTFQNYIGSTEHAYQTDALDAHTGPYCIGVYNSKVYVCEQNEGVVKIFDTSGNIEKIINSPSTSGIDYALDSFGSPSDVVLDSAGNIYIADPVKQRILVFPPNYGDYVDYTPPSTTDADTTPPVVTISEVWASESSPVNIPENQVLTTSNSTGYEFFFFTSSSDTSANATCSIDSSMQMGNTDPYYITYYGVLFPVGTNTITCTATDAAGNVGTASFTVTVNASGDTTPPVVSVPNDIIVYTTDSSAVIQLSQFLAAGNFPPTATDDDANFTSTASNFICTEPNTNFNHWAGFGGWQYEPWPMGTNTVTCTATDAAGNVGTALFTIIVTTADAPLITPSITASAFLNATSSTGRTFTANQGNWADEVSANANSTNWSVNYTITDPNGASVADSIQGWLAPINFYFGVPDPDDGQTHWSVEIPVSWEAGAYTITSSVHSSASWNTDPVVVGPFSTTVTVPALPTSEPEVEEEVEQEVEEEFEPEVEVDYAPPFIVVSEDLVRVTTNPAGRTVSWSVPSATDNVGISTIECDPSSGTFFSPGLTTVTCTATDTSGNYVSDTFTVTITYELEIDTTQPVFTPISNASYPTTDPGGAIIFYPPPSVADNIGIFASECLPLSGTLFHVGTTIVTCTATDAAQNTATMTFTVTVINTEVCDDCDTIAPVFEEVQNHEIEADATNGMVVTFPTPTATDDGVELPPDKIFCNPSSGFFFPAGLEPTETTVVCSAFDDAGNQGSTSFTVTVLPSTQPLQGEVTGEIYDMTSTGVQPVTLSGDAVSSMSAGALGYFNTSLLSDAPQNALVTIYVEGADLTPLGFTALKYVVGTTESELRMGLHIPGDAVSGDANVFVNVYPEWPDLAENPTSLVPEESTSVQINGIDETDLGAFNYYTDGLPDVYSSPPGFSAQNVIDDAVSYWKGSPPVDTFNTWSYAYEGGVNSYAESFILEDYRIQSGQGNDFVTDLTLNEVDYLSANLNIYWVKEYGPAALGIAPISDYYDLDVDVIYMSLGDSDWYGTWQPYSSKSLAETMKHEMGHVIGFAHDDDPNSLMYFQAQSKEYGIVEKTYRLTGDYWQFVPIFTSRDVTNFNYHVSTDNEAGFNVYFVPDMDTAAAQLQSNQQVDSYSGCFVEDMMSTGAQSCNNVEMGSGLFITIPFTDETAGVLTEVTVKLQENFDGFQTLSNVATTQEAPIMTTATAMTKFELLEEDIEVDLNIALLDGEEFLTIEDTVLTQDIDEFTIVGWIRPDFSEGSHDSTVVSKQNSFKLFLTDSGFEQQEGHTVIDTDRTVNLSVYDGVKWFTVSGDTEILEDWYYFAVVVDGSKASLYLDGAVEGKMILEKKVPLSAAIEEGICRQAECTVSTKMSVSDKDIVIGAYSEIRMLPNKIGIPTPDYRAFDNFSGLVSSVEVYDDAFTDKQISKLYMEDKKYYKKDVMLKSASITTASPALSDSECLDLAVESGLQGKLTETTTLVCKFPFNVVIPLNSDVLWVETLSFDDGPYHSIRSTDDLFRTGPISFASMSFYEPNFTYGVYEYFDEINKSLTGKIVIAKPLEYFQNQITTLPDKEYEKLTPIEISRDSLSHSRDANGNSVPDCAVDNSCYEPFAVSIDVRKEVTWKNLDSFSHSVTSGTPEDGPDGVFDSGLIPAIRTFSHTFYNPGIYDYYCVYHPWMEGIIIVGEI